MDPFDVDLTELGYGELCVLEDLIAGEFKRRGFPDSKPRNALPVAKKLAHLAADLRVISQSLRNVSRERELKEPKP